MDLRLDDRELDFQERLRAWLDATPVPEGLRDFGSTPTAEDIGPARAWQRLLHDGGWAGLSWPQGSGGAAATPVEQALFAEELAARGLPRQASFVSVELAGPAVIAHGTDEQRATFLPPMLTGEHVWCQLFSEPGAGSDLAALAARAAPVGDGWAVTGQKVWTSGAHYADLGLLLARTGGPGHGGITCFVLPMDRPGIEVRPIRQLDGEEKFNEVFLDGVQVGPADVLGSVDGGWHVAVSILGRERRMLGSVAIALRTALAELTALVAGDAALRRRWAALAVDVELLRWTWLRLLADERGPADPRTSALKLTASRLQREVPDLARDAWGLAFLTDPAAEAWQARLLAAFGASIAGGTSEIQRTILATRVLALPR